MGNKITINGVSFSGNNIQIINDKVIVDGKDLTPETKEINIVVDGDLIGNLEFHNGKAEIKGGVHKSVKSHNGDIKIGSVVGGDVSSHNGNIECGHISGSVKTKNGNIKHN